MEFNKILKIIEKGVSDKKENKLMYIPSPFSKLNKEFIGFTKGSYTIITANSSVGKTQLTKYMFVKHIIKLAKENLNTKFKILYFALEETEEKFMMNLLCSIYNEKYSKDITSFDLKSYTNFTVDERTIEEIKKVEAEYSFISNIVTCIDYIRTPKQIKDFCEDYFLKNGTTYFKDPDTNVITRDDNVATFNYYVENEETFNFVITDHVSLLSGDRHHKDERDVLGDFSKNVCLERFCKIYNAIVINVQQQTADKEKLEFYKGEVIEEKIEPSLDGLANNKETGRDAHYILGLFAPHRYNLVNYRNFNISSYGNRFRSLKILKDRDYGSESTIIKLEFDGRLTNFKQI